jgi:4-amino-4-deoxy-L-arabinose transferase-like glycosyltransferase
MSLASRRVDAVLVLILLVALAVRVSLGVTREYIHDEINTAIPLSKTISFEPGRLHLPLRGENHPALPAYVVKASSTLFGTSQLGYRGMHILLGLLTITLVYATAREWYGSVAARWAAALMAFNEYYLNVSSRATAHVPNLFFVTAAVYAFSRFLLSERPRYLYLAGASMGLAFYCKESTALLLPVFALTLLVSRQRRWLLKPQVYLACVIWFLVVAPDVAWNLSDNAATAKVTYNNQTVGQASYATHLKRIGGLGLSLYPSMFYFRGTVRSSYLQIMGRPLTDNTAEYESINPALGVLLLGGVLATTVRLRGRDQLRIFLLLMFWCIFGFFTMIRPGDPGGRLDSVSWIWVETTLVAAVVLASARLADVSGTWRLPVWSAASAALVWACVRLLLSQY